jgi:integrase/recombinase XerD
MKSNVTIKAVLDTRYNKQNSDTYPVRIRATFNRVQKYYPTKISLTKSQWNIIQKGKNLSELKDTMFEIREIEKKASKIVDKLSTFSFDLFEKKFLNQSDSSTIKGAFDTYINQLRLSGQIGTAIAYECARDSINKFRPDTLLTEINPDFLLGYEQSMATHSSTTISIYLRCLRCLINKAIAAGDFIKDAYPFGRYKYKLPQSKNKKKALTINEISLIAAYSGQYEKSRDYWLFMYLAAGMNGKDVCLLKKSNIKSDKLSFVRSKTERTKTIKEALSIPINDELRNIIAKYSKAKNEDDFLFPILKHGLTKAKEKQLVGQFNHVVSDHMKEIAKELKIEKFCTVAYARHSFATILKRSGASTEFIQEMLGHGSPKTTENYLDSFEDETIKEKLLVLTAFKPIGKVVNL